MQRRYAPPEPGTGEVCVKVAEGLLRKRVDRKDLLIFACVIDSRTSSVIELFQDAGFDALMIDREHSALNHETIMDHIRVARALQFPCMVRVAEDAYHELNRTLDQAPDGIYVPRIKSREQVEQVLRTVRYRPLGIRGLAGSTCPAGKYKGWDGGVIKQIETVNRNTVVGIQIETAEALEHLDDILSVKGLDIAVVGPDDLGMNMGLPGQLQSQPFLDAVERVIRTCEKHGVLPGIATGDPDAAAHWIKRGAKVIWYAADITLVWAGAVRAMADLKDRLAGN
jgi:4-hydroxy-2-oxoheptanedioate aldolase